MTAPRPLAAALAAAAWLAAAGCRPPQAVLELSVRDAVTGGVTPARLELVDSAGRAWTAPSALPVAGDCGWFPYHNRLGLWTAQIQMLRALARSLHNPFTGTTQFYLAAPAQLRLPPGNYRLRVFKGIEYRVASRDLTLAAGDRQLLEVGLERWIDLPAAGWYGADDHLHLARPHPRFDRLLAGWLAAEDLHVGNLLQMGLSGDVHVTPQTGFGPASARRRQTTIVAGGQENPRTHVLGHAIGLGADAWVDFPRSYLAYDRFFREIQRRGGIAGYAHWGLAGGEEALPLWAPDKLVDFIEVLGFGFAFYDLWYELLDLGLQVTPTAGTDYPCGPSLPGSDRFYAHVEGPFDYGSWLEAVAAGRTFVTNGPALELAIDGAGPGAELRLPGPARLRVHGRARWDPERDAIERLELVGAGGRVLAAGSPVAEGEARLTVELPVQRSTWLALRAAGTKRDQLPVAGAGMLASHLEFLGSRYAERLSAEGRLPADGSPRPAAAHTAAVRISVSGSPRLGEQPEARAVAAAWLERLAALEDRFSDARLEGLAGFPGRGDGLSSEDLEAQRPLLLEILHEARRQHRHGAAAPPP